MCMSSLSHFGCVSSRRCLFTLSSVTSCDLRLDDSGSCTAVVDAATPLNNSTVAVGGLMSCIKQVLQMYEWRCSHCFTEVFCTSWEEHHAPILVLLWRNVQVIRQHLSLLFRCQNLSMLMWFSLEHIGHNTCTVKICVGVAAGCVSFLGTSSEVASVVSFCGLSFLWCLFAQVSLLYCAVLHSSLHVDLAL